MTRVGVISDEFWAVVERFFRRKNVVDFLISFPCNAGQPAPQIVDGVSGGIEGALLYFVLLCLSDLGFRSPKVPADQVFGRSTLIPRQKIMLADQIPCELLLLHGPSGPVLRGGTQGRRRGRPPRFRNIVNMLHGVRDGLVRDANNYEQQEQASQQILSS